MSGGHGHVDMQTYMDYAAGKLGLINVGNYSSDRVTELTADLPEAIKEGVKTATPLGRFGEPHEIAAAVIYLASREASYVTGQVLGVDGGLVMM